MALKKKIKDFLYSKSCPDFISHRYFQFKDKKTRKAFFQAIYANQDLLNGIKPEALDHWKSRIQNVLDAPDNTFIPRDPSAGQIRNETLIMHNGLKIDPMSYYGLALMKMLILNKGVHEPQEEKVFQQVLKSLGGSKPLNMIELGAYWSFYSMWLLSAFPESNCIMVEPDKKNLYYGKRNFQMNGLDGKFVHAGIGSHNKANITTVDRLCSKNNIEYLDILHSDIQGYELQMLEGSKEMLSRDAVGYAFISTHSNELHESCRDFLNTYNFTEVASANPDESFSWDGILVMKSKAYSGIEQVSISKRS